MTESGFAPLDLDVCPSGIIVLSHDIIRSSTTMTEDKKIPPVVHRSYPKGELIIKEGDYGVSIYKVLKGSVRIFKKLDDRKFTLATLERGGVFGEMAFFNFLFEPRSASVEAIDDVELEVWHPALLADEYKKISPMLRYVLKQTINRLMTLNKAIGELAAKRKPAST
jgi:CRP/FNR family cyclic AMP-dependent transcriptional regulator